MLYRQIKITIITLLANNAYASNNIYDKQLLSASIIYKVPMKLIKAICLTESNLDPQALNFDDNGKGQPAIGVCQILYSTAKELGYEQKQNNLCGVNLSKNKRVKENCQLYDVDINLKYASIYLKYQLIRYNNNWADAAAAYNSGSVRHETLVDKNGRQIRVYRNQGYVNKVLNNLNN